MKLEQQVTSLELSKRLKALNVEQDSLFYWIGHENLTRGEIGEDKCTNWYPMYKGEKYFGNHDYQISAFTVAELGEMLPNELEFTEEDHTSEWELFSVKLDSLWRVYYVKRFHNTVLIESDMETEVDARAKCLIFLLENGYVDFKNNEVQG